jgi:uncharacterized protein involved in response to NO
VRPALLAQGYRPLFLGAGLSAVAAMALWAAGGFAAPALPTAFSGTVWHAHEMIFGALAAVLAGFLTTMIPNWTGSWPPRGRALAGFAGLWLAGRLVCAGSAWTGPGLALAVDGAFLVLLAGLVAREVVAGRNWRNWPLVGFAGGLALANVLVHLGPVAGVDPGVGLRFGLSVFAVHVALIGGRFAPAATRRLLVKRGDPRRPAQVGPADRGVVLLTLAAALAWTLRPDGAATAALTGLAAGANLWRLTRWQPLASLREPLVAALHLAYLWLTVGLGLIALATAVPGMERTAALHALTVGALGVMPMTIMARTTLGFTGRAIAGGRAVAAAVAAVSLAAVLRVSAPAVPSLYADLTLLSAVAWIAAFALFLALYAAMLLAPARRAPR